MAKSELWLKGDAVRTEMLGEAAAKRLDTSGIYDHPMMEAFSDYVRETCFGWLWSRPGLDKKMRPMICIITDTATRAMPELALHLRMARRMGWTEEEISEVFLQMCSYIGIPIVREAMIVAKRVFEELRAEEAAAGKS
jgi:4-carboxymuconolactone decarboxylase